MYVYICRYMYTLPTHTRTVYVYVYDQLDFSLLGLTFQVKNLPGSCLDPESSCSLWAGCASLTPLIAPPPRGVSPLHPQHGPQCPLPAGSPHSPAVSPHSIHTTVFLSAPPPRGLPTPFTACFSFALSSSVHHLCRLSTSSALALCCLTGCWLPLCSLISDAFPPGTQLPLWSSRIPCATQYLKPQGQKNQTKHRKLKSFTT